MYSHHRFDHEFEKSGPARVSYAVCSTPRCGSSLLCEGLFDSGLAGAPTEYFDPTQRERFCAVWGVDSSDAYVAALLEKKTSPNGVFGFKAHLHQFRGFFGDRDAFRDFPDLRLIHIARRDEVGQAVSYARAVQTNRWASDHSAVRRREVFDFEQIDGYLRQIRREEQEWERFFGEKAVAPLRVVYEDLVGDYEGRIREVLAFLGMEVPEGWHLPPPSIARQADRRSDAWARRFRFERRRGRAATWIERLGFIVCSVLASARAGWRAVSSRPR